MSNSTKVWVRVHFYVSGPRFMVLRASSQDKAFDEGRASGQIPEGSRLIWAEKIEDAEIAASPGAFVDDSAD